MCKARRLEDYDHLDFIWVNLTPTQPLSLSPLPATPNLNPSRDLHANPKPTLHSPNSTSTLTLVSTSSRPQPQHTQRKNAKQHIYLDILNLAKEQAGLPHMEHWAGARKTSPHPFSSSGQLRAQCAAWARSLSSPGPSAADGGAQGFLYLPGTRISCWAKTETMVLEQRLRPWWLAYESDPRVRCLVHASWCDWSI